jgi:hypothetical protein
MSFTPISKNNLEGLRQLQLDFKNSNKHYQNWFFADGNMWEVSQSGIRKREQKNLVKYIWKDEVINAPSTLQEPPFKIVLTPEAQKLKAEKKKLDELEPADRYDIIISDPTNYFLQFLFLTSCEHWEEFEATGKSLRYYVKWQCVECKKISDKRYREQNEEKVKQRKKDYYEENKEIIFQKQKEYEMLNQEKIKERRKIYQKNYKEKYPERNKERQKRYKEKHKEKIDIYNKEYRKRTQPQRNENTRRYRARKRKQSLIDIPFEQIQSRIDDFKGCCAYCDKPLDGKRVSQIDHFIPLSKGGWHCLSNIVPACISCNSSKCNQEPIEWFKSKEFYGDKRLKKILKILGKDNPEQLTFL